MTVFTRATYHALLRSAMTAVIAFVAFPPPAAAAPTASGLAIQRAAAERAANEYVAARRRAAAIEASAAAASERLDALVEEQRVAQDRLSSHVQSSYRYGPMGFLEVITSAASFEEFATRWFFITRINENDAVMLADIKTARARALTQARRLLDLQERAARELRAAEGVAAKARADLASSRAAYAAYRARVNAATSTSPAAKRPSPRYSNRSGTGAWSSAKASHYGRGSWGHRTADGTTVRSDSMIVAHKTLPFGTLVEFEYNGRRAVARVADRGPYVAGRVWDLGPGVIAVLGFNGVHTVRYRIIGR